MIFSALHSALQSLQHLADCEFDTTVTISILTIWFCWRVWKFTIIPLIWPNEPLVFPYFVPLLGNEIIYLPTSHKGGKLTAAISSRAGHTLSFLINPEGTIRNAK